jgi:hypothetical protein
MGKGSTNGPSEMGPPFRPIEARAAENPPPDARLPQIDAELRKKLVARRRDVASLFAENKMTMRAQAFGKSDAKLSGQMVVAGARPPPFLLEPGIGPVARRRHRSDIHDPFKHAADTRPREAEIPVAPLFHEREEFCVGELGEMSTRGLRRDPGRERKFARGQSAAVEQRAENVRARGVAHGRRYLRNFVHAFHRSNMGVMAGGTAAMGVGLLILSAVSLEWSAASNLVLVEIGFLVAGIGLGLNAGPVVSAAVSAAPESHAGTVSGIVNTARIVGATLGVAVHGAVYASKAGQTSTDAAGIVEGFRYAMWGAAASELLSTVVALFFIRDDALRRES